MTFFAGLFFLLTTPVCADEGPVSPPAVQETVILTTPEEIQGAPMRFPINTNIIGLEVDIQAFSSAVDIYLALITPEGELFFIDSDNTLTLEMLPHALGTTDALSTRVANLGIIHNGYYTGAWFITPANNGNFGGSLANPYTLGLYGFEVVIDDSTSLGWSKTYGGASEDSAYSVCPSGDGGFVFAGSTKSSGAGEYDVYVVKTDGDGNEIWSKTYGGESNDGGKSVCSAGDGSFIIAGYTKSFGAGEDDVYLIKIDGNGNEIWSKTYGGTAGDAARSVYPVTDGGFIVAGYTASSGAGKKDAYLIKVNNNGDEIWSKTFGSDRSETGHSVQQTADGGFIVAGYAEIINVFVPQNDIYLLKTDHNGNQLWTKTFGGGKNESGSSVRQTSDGGFIIAGITFSYGLGNHDAYLIRTDNTGNELWSKTFGGIRNESGTFSRETDDGGFILAGYTESFGAGKKDIALIRTDSDGNELWFKTFGKEKDDICGALHQTDDGGFLIAGYSKSVATDDYDAYLVRTDSDGNFNSPVLDCMEKGGEWSTTDNMCLTCDADHFYLCKHVLACRGAGGYWYDWGCNAAPDPDPVCRLECTPSGFTYSCGSDVSTHETTYCYEGLTRHVRTSYTLYSNGFNVRCSSAFCGDDLYCVESFGASCY